jgi:ATP-dependent Clp protease ATP-binding subunit ClpC
MYERFTDRARKVMQLANQEAQRFNHKCIGTEHVLLGLVKNGRGVATVVFRNLDVNLVSLRQEVEKLVICRPDVVTIGRLPQSSGVKSVIEYSLDEARSLRHNYVGTEHILLGLMREREGVAAQVLTNAGLTLESVREEVLNLLGHGIEWTEPQETLAPYDGNTPKIGLMSKLWTLIGLRTFGHSSDSEPWCVGIPNVSKSETANLIQHEQIKRPDVV